MSLRGVARACASGARAGAWWFNGILGGGDYQRYVEHMRRNHPGSEVASERTYWRERYAEADANPATRCC
ncbi:hypothetical protein GCM10023318_02950 [Nocardia callitridis]|uniref:DUF466 domain-containing protein n=2 Tax=Nocardia callitridis TaxID=648753 RepID=A0ABP9JS52_9NOCA